jgi:hypothetical protein
MLGLVLTSYGAIYFSQRVSTLQTENDYLGSRLSSVSDVVNVAVDFGNGTRAWYNDTYIPVGSSVFNATYISVGGRVTTQVYSLGNVSEVFVTGILGLSGNSSSYWLWYYFDNSTHRWAEADVGADSFLAVQGGTYLWNYTRG